LTWTIEWTERARRDLRRLDRQMAERALTAVERLAATEQGDVTRLQGVEPPEWRLRVGDWRIRFQYDYQRHSIEVLRVLPRGRAYRD
jgi:mRNA interferase RelE/StbE